MTTRSFGRRHPADYDAQVRVNNLGDSGEELPKLRPKPQSTSKYGVAVRVQGIAGQPYVVLKDGQRGDSYGVQLRTDYSSSYGSLPRRKEKAEVQAERSDVGGVGGQLGLLRRVQSHGSLLDKDGGGSSEDFQLSRPPGDGKSGSYGNLDGGIGVRRGREEVWGTSDRGRVAESTLSDRSHQIGSNRSLESVRNNDSYPDSRQQANGPPPYQRQTPVNRLVTRYDGAAPGNQQRGLAPSQQHPRATSPLLHPKPYTSPPSSAHSSLGHGQASGSRVAGLSANQWTSEEPRHVDRTELQVRTQLCSGWASQRALLWAINKTKHETLQE